MDGGGAITFLHLVDPILGRLQIFNGTCPTPGDPYTEFRIVEPKSVAMADSPLCEATGGTTFTLSGGPLGSGIQVTTDSDGNWRGYLPVDASGATTYRVTDDSVDCTGECGGDVTVIVDDISVVIVVNYFSWPLDVLNVSRFACEDPNPTGISVSVSDGPPDAWNDNACSPAEGRVRIDVTSEVSAASVGTYAFDSSGQIEVDLEPGSYRVTDVASGEYVDVNLEAGVRVWTLIQDVITGSGGVGEGPGGDGTGANPDGIGNPNGGPGIGDSTNGGINAGAISGAEDYDAELAGVTGLPDTGAGGASHDGILAVIVLASAALLCGFGARRRVLARRGA